jgi:hypothetical protein
MSNNPSKRTQRAPKVDGGFAAIGGYVARSGSATRADTAGNTTSVASILPLKAPLVLKANFIELLPIASHPFLTPLAKSALRKFATFFYAEEKGKETKSDPTYLPSSVKKLGIVLQVKPEVQESQGFKTLHNELTADLEKFCHVITKEYLLKVSNLNVAAKKMQYHVAVCKWMQGLAHQAFTAQQGVKNYTKDVAIIDLITKHRDHILVPLGMTTKTFLAAYKAANNLQVIPSPTINLTSKNSLTKSMARYLPKLSPRLPPQLPRTTTPMQVPYLS